jgi:4-hydroxyphenylpyruvate dioxygenase
MSRALTSPYGRIRIPINEDRGKTDQISDYLNGYNGEGIQHIAVGSENIYDSTDQIAANGVRFMPPLNSTYYDLSHARVNGHSEPLDRLQKNGILIDGEGVLEGGEPRYYCRHFPKLW